MLELARGLWIGKPKKFLFVFLNIRNGLEFGRVFFFKYICFHPDLNCGGTKIAETAKMPG